MLQGKAPVDRLGQLKKFQLHGQFLVHFIHKYNKVKDVKMLCVVESMLQTALQNHQNIQILVHTSNVCDIRKNH